MWQGLFMLDNRYVDDNPLAKVIAQFSGGAAAGNPLGQLAQLGMEQGAQVAQSLRAEGPSALPGAALKAVLAVLDAPREMIARQLGTTGEAIDDFGGGLAESVGIPRGLGEFATSVLTDPTTYIGVGAAKGLVKGAAKAGLKEANPFMKVLKGAAKVDSQVSEAGEQAAGALVNALQSGLVPANKTLGRLFPELPRWTEYANKSKALQDAVQWLQDRQGLDLPTASTKQTLHTLLPTELQSRVSKDELDNLVAYGMAQGNKLGNVSWDAVLPGYLNQTREAMGLKTDGKFRKMYTGLTDWWKRQAVASPANLGQNLAGGMLFGALEGVNPLDTLGDVWKNRGAILKGDQFDIADAAKMEAKTGVPIPSSLDQGVQAAATANAGSGAATPQAADIFGLGALGAVADGATGALVGGGLGAVLAPYANKMRQISQGLETVMRQRGYVKGMGDELVSSMDEMEQVIRDALMQERAPTLGRLKADGTRGKGRASGVPDPAFAEGLVEKLRTSNGQINLDDLDHALLNSARAKPEVVDEAMRQIDDILYRASQKGIGKANASNFDYQDLSNIERALTTISPFATWYLKAVPFVTKKAGATPLLAQAPIKFNEQAEEDRAASGLTSRVAGAMENPIGSTLLSALLGRDVKTFQNPVGQFLPFADTSRNISNLEYADNPGEMALGLMNVLGLGLNPLIEAPLRVAGAFGTDAPVENNLIRTGTITGALTGVNPNEGIGKIEGTIRENLSGKQPTDLNTVAIAKRLDELALRETGTTTGSGKPAVAAYIRAKAQQSGPLWDAAKREVEAERNLSGVAGFVNSNLRPQAIVTPEEEQIRAAGLTALVPKETSQSIREAAKAKPKADAQLPHVQAVLDAMDKILEQTGKDVLPPEVEARLANPTNENINWIAGQVFAWEADHDPLKRGYNGSGSPEKRTIQAQQAQLSTAGQNLGPLQTKPGQNPFKVPAQMAQKERQGMLQSSPQLQAYLGWKALNPTGTVDDYLAQAR
jgi:hypothetical protein